MVVVARWSRRFNRRLVSSAAAVSLLVAFGIAAITARGLPATDVHLHDGGVWVTNRVDGFIGRFNRPIEQLDAALSPGRSTLPDIDVVQDGTAVLLIDRDHRTLRRVDVAGIELAAGGAALPEHAAVAMNGGVAAVMDETTGRIWVRPSDTVAGLDITLDEPDAEVGGQAALAVGVDGSVHAVSSIRDTLITIGSDRTVSERPIGADITAGQVTAVGSRPVVLDSSGLLVLPDRRVTLGAGSGVSGGAGAGVRLGQARLQHSGPAAASVVIATESALIDVSLSTGDVAVLLDNLDSSPPAAPVRLAGCVHAAWGAPAATYLKRCDAMAAEPPIALHNVGSSPQLVFRTNRDAIVLNDEVSGSVYLFDRGGETLGDWQKTIEQARPDPDRRELDSQRDPETNSVPRAGDDSLRARPAAATVLHVLDNDGDSDGDILIISSVTGLTPAGVGRVAIVASGQALEYVAGDDPADRVVRFRYTVDDGRGARATARVTLTVSGQGNRPPVRHGASPDLVVERGGTTTYDLVEDWRDPDGDNLAVTAVSAPLGSGVADTTPDGAVAFTAARDAAGSARITVTISDGYVELSVVVVVSIVTTDRPPRARDDIAVVAAGRRESVAPLLNDADANVGVPGGPQRLRLSYVSPAPPGVGVTPDYLAGTVTVLADRPGSHYLTYRLSDGVHESQARIRVEVRGAAGRQTPVAVLDTTTIHPGSSTMVDVLANDFDADADVLVVREASADETDGLSVSVVDHRWLRIAKDNAPAKARRSFVRYVISDGLHSDTGVVAVTEVDESPDNRPPRAAADVANVRAGDVVKIDVLDNDRDPEGQAMMVDPMVVPDDSGFGTWMVGSTSVWFHAPARPGVATATYTVRDERGAAVAGQLSVIVIDSAAINQAPQPPPLQARVFAGAGIRVDLSLTMVDPNGDSVIVLGPERLPSLGSIVRQGVDFVEYQAYPDAAGTDEFSYRVMDPFGAVGVASVRVGVAPPSPSDAPPTAVDDVFIVAPGATARIPVLANDSDVDGDPLVVEELDADANSAGGVDAGGGHSSPRASLVGQAVVLTAGPRAGDVVSVRYSITDGRGKRASALATVVSQIGANVAPTARDDLVESWAPAQPTVDVDVLANDDDVDGTRERLTVYPIDLGGAAPTVVTPEGNLRITLTERPRHIAYRITDAHGGGAIAFVRVFGTANQPPRRKPDAAPLVIVAGQTLDVSLGAIVMDPDADAVRITSADSVIATPTGRLGVVDAKTTSRGFRLVAARGYVGAGSVAFRVTDSVDEVTIVVAVTVVSDNTAKPTFACPSVAVVAGAPAIYLDLSRCVRDSAGRTLTFGQLSTAPPGVSAWLDGTRLWIVARADAAAGERAPLAVTAVTASGTSTRGAIGITVRPPGRIIAVTDTVTGVRAGELIRVDVTANDVNPFPATALRVTSVRQVSGATAAASVDTDGRHLLVRPSAPGTAVLTYVVRDATGRAERDTAGRVVLSAVDRPAPPGRPTAQSTGSGFAVLSWDIPAANGTPITSYRVTGSPGGTRECPSSVCRVDGLTNGTEYVFRVVAVNAVGPSDPSQPSAPVRLDAKPGRPDPPVTQFGDSSITVHWQPPATDGGSSIRDYEVQISPSVGPPRVLAATSLTWTGLANGTAYAFRVRARNATLASDWSAYSAPDVPAGAPRRPAAPTAVGVDDGVGESMLVRWAAPGANGAPISAYHIEVYRAGTYDRTVAVASDLTQVHIGVSNGVSYAFRVMAENKAGRSAPSGLSAAASAHGRPLPITTHSYSDNDHGAGYDRRVAYAVVAPSDNGMAITRYEFDIDDDSIVDQATTQTAGFLDGLVNGRGYAVRVRACNTSCGAWSASGNTVVPYGPVPLPVADALRYSPTQIHLIWAAGGAHGRAIDHFDVRIDGGAWQNVGPSMGGWVVGDGYGQTHSIDVRAFDVAGQASSIAHAQATTDPPPLAAPASPASPAGNGAQSQLDGNGTRR